MVTTGPGRYGVLRMSAAAQGELSGFTAEPPQTGGRTLVLGTTFAVCGPGGDMGHEEAEGLFVRDSRILSRWQLRIDGHAVQPLGGFAPDPFVGVFLARAHVRDGRAEPTLLVERRRSLGEGMHEDLVFHNHGLEPAGVSVVVEMAADFADLFAVKVGRPSTENDVTVTVGPEEWQACARGGAVGRCVRVRAAGSSVTTDGVAFRAVIPPAGIWRAALEVTTSLEVPGARPRTGARDRAVAPSGSSTAAERRSLTLETGSLALSATVTRSQKDLAALALADPANPEDVVVAAGAPWFMALFGRDSLLTSSMALVVDPGLAVGTLRALARHQGRRTDPLTEEQPGRILHELRFGVDPSLALGGSDRYFGSVDATPLFVVVLGQMARWGVDPQVIDELLPAADRALKWVTEYGDRDGDGFVEYLRSTDRGLRNQGWKDSADGITFADGTIAEPPIALVEVQAYVYRAYRARSELAVQRGAAAEARDWAERASTLKRSLNEQFWLPELGTYAVGLDAHKRPIDALTSNIGHVLWAGAADLEKAAGTAERLLSPELFSGYGIRTLATSMGAYNPASYHNGSVWPHDTALAVSGLVRYGFTGHAQRVATGLIEAASYFSGRLPELFCGFEKATLPGPVPYPTSCSPQAWASAAPLEILVAMVGLHPDIPAGTVRLSPAIPSKWGAMRIADVPLGPASLTVDIDRDGTVTTTGADQLDVADGTSATPL